MEINLLIQEARHLLNSSAAATVENDEAKAILHLGALNELLTKELVGDAPDQGPEQLAAEQAAGQATEQQIDEQLAADEAAEPEQPDEKTKSDAANKRQAGNWPY